MIDYYNNWKEEKAASLLPANEIINRIRNLLISQCEYYGLVGLMPAEIEINTKFILEYLKQYPKIKMMDIERAVSLNKKLPDLNKITPNWFETIFEKYRKSDERKVILKTWEEDLEAHSNELTEAKKEYDANELLQICFNNWKQTGIINLNSGLVYEKNYLLLKDKIGLDKMELLKKKVQKRLISEHSEALNKMSKKSSLRDEAERQLKLIKEGEGLVKRETRKEHLRNYFENLNCKIIYGVG